MRAERNWKVFMREESGLLDYLPMWTPTEHSVQAEDLTLAEAIAMCDRANGVTPEEEG